MKKLSVTCFWMFIVLFQFGVTSAICSEVIYTYDDLNRIERVEKQGNYSIDYTYDAVGNRISKVTLLPPSQPVVQSENNDDAKGESWTASSYFDKEENE